MSASHLNPLLRSLGLPLGLLFLGGLLLSGCAGSRKVQEPTLEVLTSGGRELGVSTDFGVVFLGRTARSGEVELVSWYGDGPGTELSVIEPLGGGLYTAETEIRLPSTAMTFQAPRPGRAVSIVGRRGSHVWTAEARVREDPRVQGLLLSVPNELRGRPERLGAGVYVDDEATGQRRLLGLVSGQVSLRAPDGAQRSYLTVVGPDQLWRLVAQRRNIQVKPRWVYRDDIL